MVVIVRRDNYKLTKTNMPYYEDDDIELNGIAGIVVGVIIAIIIIKVLL